MPHIKSKGVLFYFTTNAYSSKPPLPFGSSKDLLLYRQ